MITANANAKSKKELKTTLTNLIGVMKTKNFLQIIFVSFSFLLSNEPKLITTDFFCFPLSETQLFDKMICEVTILQSTYIASKKQD